MSTAKLGTALITGASTGIGAIYADRLAKRGYDLILVARDKTRLENVANKAKYDHGVNTEVISADLTVKADLLALENRLRTDSSITLLINNAGLGATAPLLDSNLDDLEKMIFLNTTTLTRLSGAVAPNFVKQGKGVVINIASIVALAPEMLNGSYSGTKAYVVNFTQSMHHELADKGIKVQAVLPGAIDTPFWDKSGLPVHNLPAQMVMTPDNLVDAALSGFDQGELITIPSLPDATEWDALDAARKVLTPNLSRNTPAARYLN